MPTMRNSIFSEKIYSILLSAYRWYLRTPERSLEEAYKAALNIKAIEDEHFHGNKIDFNSTIYSNSVMDYFESDLAQELKTARMRLTEFRFSRWFSNESHQKAARKAGIEYPSSTVTLEKLKFIDEVISKYIIADYEIAAPSVVSDSQMRTTSLQTPENPLLTDSSRTNDINKNNLVERIYTPTSPPQLIKQRTGQNKKPRGKADTTGILPRSILSTIGRLQIELDPNAEQDVINNFRQAQKRSIISIRFILLLIIVPLLTHQLSKALIVSPIFNHFKNADTEQIFLNSEMEEEALSTLHRFEERIKFENLISNAPPLSAEAIETQIKEKAAEIAAEFRDESSNAIKNVFADIFSVGAFIWLLLVSKPSIMVLKEFFDNVVYGLSDSAKAFIIILFTDVFVGFHSPHGWEVILEGLSRHWGLPANRDFIFLFIATFPVILDTIFKYWIFRYLNRISPSAVATYRNMNE
ncbi:proton extrusion protein PcxA [Nostoc parmelioides]|uniref:Proton extrusion protein PxcA n=1 Tax=Nostoc parmelioides FACHB-3921 TaxID=2692909 RepID=A0ABR8BBX5_9NOSO|nr:proton extrusion protein PcxA [Nostoc parmelioides]MBD2250463.1 proton extrusion protein PcxA [Nostoc parmelioides FACHB-3921]